MQRMMRVSSHLHLKVMRPTATNPIVLNNLSITNSLPKSSNCYSNIGTDVNFQQFHFYSTTLTKYNEEKDVQTSSPPQSENPESLILYQGPFSSLAKRLKRISITSAIVSIIGIPLLITFHSGDVPVSGQAAVGSTAIIAATGSTAALSFCFGPYVNELKYVQSSKSEEGGGDGDTKTAATTSGAQLVQVTTTNIFGMEKITIFDPEQDVSPAPSNNKRPFCNFMIKDEPYYIHPNLLNNEKLRIQLLGEEKFDDENDEKKKNKKALDDDEFL